MHRPTPLKTATLPIPNLISLSPLRRGFSVVVLAFALGLFALSVTAQAVDPPPDGGYPNGNTAEGEDALFSLTTGFDNVAIGYEALFGNTTGIENTGSGYRALYSNTTGTRNTATGNGALSRNTTGGNNTADGLHALFLTTTGKYNTGIGAFVLSVNTFGSNNIALGYKAGSSLTTGNDNIDIGNVGVAGESGTLRIGTPGKQIATFVAGIRGTTTANANTVPEVIDSAGQLGTVSSSQRFKSDIQQMDSTSEAVLKLKPVTFHYTTDSTITLQFGLIAEEVAKVNPDLVVRDDKGKIYTVRYEAVNAMLLNEFLKEHQKVEEQAASIAQMKKQIEALTATVQRASDQLQLSKSSAQLDNK